MRGMKVTWDKGKRSLIESKDIKGRSITRMGKNGGPVVQQTVTMCLVPKA